MISKELQNICWRVWESVREWVKDNPLIDIEDMRGACAICSYTLYKVLIRRGYSPKFILLENNNKCHAHCVVELNGKIFDLSVRQFKQLGQKQSDILVAKWDKYFKTVPKVKQFKKMLVDKEAISIINKEWTGQNPILYRNKINYLVRKLAA